MAEDSPSMTCRMLAGEFDCCFETITNILHQLVGNLIFGEITTTDAEVRFTPPAEWESKAMVYELHVHEKTPTAPSQKTLFTSSNKTISTILTNLTKYGILHRFLTNFTATAETTEIVSLQKRVQIS
ncbi:hypothetical protein KIN20_032657 [Parelaphostrongylus tenuis]|uniref:Uncharacterized protein n=1 Tax=Parelaphostrongylus tenuis TaxID=148309 RepID=A0AAD5R6S9_PARTN|nr:hypothetical protein KIN20_032657 [Parelaphostrongylus tenuis]